MYGTKISYSRGVHKLLVDMAVDGQIKRQCYCFINVNLIKVVLSLHSAINAKLMKHIHIGTVKTHYIRYQCMVYV